MISCCQGFWGEKDKKVKHRGQGSETTLYEAVMVDTCHNAFIKTHRTIHHRE